MAFIVPIAEKAPRNRGIPPSENSMDMSDVSVASNTDIDCQATQSPAQSQQSVDAQGKRKKKGPKRPKVWDGKKEENLIEMMRERIYMYDMDNDSYHNRIKKNAAVAYMAKELGVTGM